MSKLAWHLKFHVLVAWTEEAAFIAGRLIAGDYRDLFEEFLESL